MVNSSSSVSEPQGSDAYLRRFSAQAVQALRTSIDDIKKPTGSENNNLRSSVATILSEASFYGFPATARLTRKLHDILWKQDRLADADSSIISAIEQGLDLLQVLVDRPSDPANASAVDAIIAVLDDLQVQLEPPAQKKPIFQFGTVSTVPLQTTGVAASDHQDLDIYSSDVIDGMEKCSDEESWIVTQLASAAEDLAGRRSDAKPAHKLQSILRGHRFFQRVDRVCVVGLMPHANQLVVVDSVIHDRMREMGFKNRMPRGYSCFVNPEGSLSKMRPGVLRIFSDSQTVLESFAKEGKPAQRSIAYIAESGLRSGICLAMGRGENVQGYLFMNSIEPNLFDNVMRDYAPLLSLFSLMGTIALDGAGFHAVEDPNDIDGNASLSKHSEVFRSDEFCSYLQGRIGQLTDSECHVTLNCEEGLRFLYIPAVIVTVLSELVFRLGLAVVGKPNEVRLRIVQDGEQVSFSLSRPASVGNLVARSWMETMVRDISRRYINRPLAFDVSGDQVVLTVPYEPVLPIDHRVLYSVAF